MNLPRFVIGPFFGSLAGVAIAAATLSSPMPLAPPDWKQLPALPDREGFASPFAGVAAGSLVVAGGANFPDRRPWEGGKKVWSAAIFSLSDDLAGWEQVGILPRPCAYGLSVTLPEGVLCIGGGDATNHFASCFLLALRDGRVVVRDFPSLPRPLALASGTRVGSWVFVIGGMESPSATSASPHLLGLDLTAIERGWVSFGRAPGPARILATAGSRGEEFYVFGGDAVESDPSGKTVRRPLKDAYSFSLQRGWRRLCDLPRAATAAPSPAPLSPAGEFLLISGDDGMRGHLTGPDHPGFPTDMLAYDPTTDSWRPGGPAPFSRATTPTVRGEAGWFVVSGERKPGFRSNEVWLLLDGTGAGR